MKIPLSVLVSVAVAVAAGLIEMRVAVGRLETALTDVERRVAHIEEKLDRSELARNP